MCHVTVRHACTFKWGVPFLFPDYCGCGHGKATRSLDQTARTMAPLIRYNTSSGMCMMGTNTIILEGVCMCNTENNAFFTHYPQMSMGCCWCTSEWASVIPQTIRTTSTTFLVIWSVCLLYFTLSLRVDVKQTKLHRMFVSTSLLRTIYWIDPRGILGLMNGHLQSMIHYTSLAINVNILCELMRAWITELVAINATSAKHASTFSKVYKTLGYVFSATLLLVLAVAYCIFAIDPVAQFGSWYYAVFEVWPIIYGVGVAVISVVMVYFTGSLQQTFWDQQPQLNADANKDGEKQHTEKSVKPSSRHLRRALTLSGDEKKANHLPPHIVVHNKALFVLGIIQIVSVIAYFAIQPGAQSGTLREDFVIKFTSIDSITACLIFWCGYHFIGLKYFKTLHCWKSWNARKRGKDMPDRNQNTNPEIEFKQNVSRGDAAPRPRHSQRAASPASKTMPSPDDINDGNIDQMIHLVLEEAKRDCGTENTSSFTPDGESDSSTDDEEEYSFDHVKRVVVAENRKRVSIYDAGGYRAEKEGD